MIQFILMGTARELWAELTLMAQLEMATGFWLYKYKPGEFSKN